MTIYSAVVLGCGPRGRHHARAFLANSDRFRLAALCDTNAERLSEAAAELGVERTYADGEEMLAAEKPDVFCFCTQPSARLGLVQLALRHGVKAIAYEKPMATSLAEARAICRVTDAAGVKTVVSHQHKYGSHWRKVREIVEAGDIGDVHTIHSTSKGWMLQYATHLIDYTMFLNGGAGGARGEWVTGHIHGRDKLDDTHPSPGYFSGQIGFENGVRGIIECGPLAPDMPGDNDFWLNAGATVYGTHGYARVIVGSGWQAVTKSSGGFVSGEGRFDVERDQPPYIADLARWLDDPAAVHPCNGEVSLHGFELTVGMVQSALDNVKVELPVETDEPILERMAGEL